MNESCEGSPKGAPCPQAIAAADHAVRQVFAIVGVNVDDPEKVENFREELRFGRMVKRVSDRTFTAIVITIVTISIGAILYKLGIR